jgi:hypothetical protein
MAAYGMEPPTEVRVREELDEALKTMLKSYGSMIAT